VLWAVLRVAVVTGSMLTVYATAPIGDQPTRGVAVRLSLALLLLGLVLGWQLRSVIRSDNPTLRGVETVATSVPLFVLMFAAAYVAIDQTTSDSFTEPVNRIDGVYFAVTVLATVGFGDIAPTSELTRVMVTVQMIVDLILVGLIAKVLVGAVRMRRQALRHPPRL